MLKKIFLPISILFLMSVVVYSAPLSIGIDKDGVVVGDGIGVGTTAQLLISSSSNASNSMDCKDWGFKNFGPYNCFTSSSMAITTSTTAAAGEKLNSYCLEVGETISVNGENQGPIYGRTASGTTLIYRIYIDLKKKR